MIITIIIIIIIIIMLIQINNIENNINISLNNTKGVPANRGRK